MGTTKSFFEEAKISARSLKNNNNNIYISIITSKKIKDHYSDGVFDILIQTEEVRDDVRDKIFHLNKTPFERTLYLDHDTLVLGDINPIFDLLERVDIAAAIAPMDPVVTIDGVPDCFPELNTGVLAYKWSEDIDEFLDDWLNHLIAQIEIGRPGEDLPGKDIDNMESLRFGKLHGQPPFREALYKSDLTFSVLPREYNFRGFGASAYSEVKILHDPNRKELSQIINDALGKRIYTGDQLRYRSGHSKTIKNYRE